MVREIKKYVTEQYVSNQGHEFDPKRKEYDTIEQAEEAEEIEEFATEFAKILYNRGVDSHAYWVGTEVYKMRSKVKKLIEKYDDVKSNKMFKEEGQTVHFTVDKLPSEAVK